MLNPKPCVEMHEQHPCPRGARSDRKTESGDKRSPGLPVIPESLGLPTLLTDSCRQLQAPRPDRAQPSRPRKPWGPEDTGAHPRPHPARSGPGAPRRPGLACSAAARALGPGPGSRGMSPPQPTSQPRQSERAEPAAAPQPRSAGSAPPWRSRSGDCRAWTEAARRVRT